MQKNVQIMQKPTDDTIWVKTLYAIYEYIKSNHKKKKQWFRDMVKETNGSPGDRILGTIFGKLKGAKKLEPNHSIDTLFDGESSSQLEHAKAYVQTIFKLFLDYELQLDSLSLPKVKYDNEEKKYIVAYISGKEPKIIKDLNDSTKNINSIPEERKLIEMYTAYYLSRPEVPLIGKITIIWETDENKNLITICSAELTQFMWLKKELKFEATEISKFELPSSQSSRFIFYITFKQVQEPLQFKTIVDIDLTQREIIFGSFASLRDKEIMSPSSGWVLLSREPDKNLDSNCENLQENNVPEEYEEMIRLLRNPNSISSDKITNKTEEYRKKYYSIHYFLTKKILVTENAIYSDYTKLPTYENWYILATKYVGAYHGYFHLPDEDGVFRQDFVLEIFPTGKCEMRVGFATDIKSHPGIVRIDKDLLVFFFKYDSDNDFYEFRFTVKISGNVTQKHVGVFGGVIEHNGKSTFATGILVIKQVEKNELNKLVKKEKLNDETLEEYAKDIAKDIDAGNKGFTDGLFIKEAFELEQPKIHNNLELLRGLNLHRHYKYFTFRVPKDNNSGSDIEQSFRVEKNDVKFSEDFKSVEVKADINKTRKYKGNVYYNGKVLLLILNPVNEQTIPDNYFVIQLELPHRLSGKGSDLIFGASMWRGLDHIEAKTVVFIKAEEKDEEVVTYRIGTHGERDNAGLEATNKEDKRYKGVFSYLIGRINRHIHVSSRHNTEGFVRPRDRVNREPYIFAALYLANKIDEMEKNSNGSEENQSEIDELIKQTKEYLFEGYLHQYASQYHAGREIKEIKRDRRINRGSDIYTRIVEIEKEQIILKKEISKIQNIEIKNYAMGLWPYLE